MVFPEIAEATVNESAPVHRLAAKAQIKLLETEAAGLLADGNYLKDI